MMTTTNMHIARAGAAAIAAALALSPTYAAAPKPIIDLSKSPALSNKPAAAPTAATAGASRVGPFDQRTVELGGGAIVVLALGAGAFALTRRKRRHDADWSAATGADEPRDPLFDEPMFQHEPIADQPSAFAWDRRTPATQRTGGRRHGESWVERARRGPTPDNPSLSLRKRLKRAAFFDKREREAAAGEARPVDADAGLPDAAVNERELEAA